MLQASETSQVILESKVVVDAPMTDAPALQEKNAVIARVELAEVKKEAATLQQTAIEPEPTSTERREPTQPSAQQTKLKPEGKGEANVALPEKHEKKVEAAPTGDVPPQEPTVTETGKTE